MKKTINTYVSFPVQKWKQRSIESEKFHLYIKGVLSIWCAETIFFFWKKMFLINQTS